jgi:glycosyltransferase involved in cell wall biosynthesis
MLHLSICIPVYRTDVRKLVLTLLEQIKRLTDVQVDIVLIDDASGEPFASLNTFNDELIKSIYLEQNIGRAKIRNLFLQYTNAQYLLFIDGDSTVLNEKFVFNYTQSLSARAVPVLVGASCYQQERPERHHLLRWRYSTQRESLNYELRVAKKQAGFKTNNFVIDRIVLSQIGFEERLTGYGHEDTLYGVALQQAQIAVAHLDNPVWNLNLDDNTTFLTKTDQALKNLLWIQSYAPSSEILEMNQLLATYLKLSKSGRTKWLLQVLIFFTIPMKKWLSSGGAPLFIFDIYRLARLSALEKQTR